MTLADLARFAGTTVAHVVEVAYAGRGSAVAKTSKTSKVTSKPKSKGGKIARGGMSPDAVLAAVASVRGPAKLEDVRARVAGTVPQVRAALQKLAGVGKVAITGQRRGTR